MKNAKNISQLTFLDAHVCLKYNTIDETGSIVTEDTAKSSFYCEQFKIVSQYKANLPTHMAKHHKKRKATTQGLMKQARTCHWEECKCEYKINFKKHVAQMQTTMRTKVLNKLHNLITLVKFFVLSLNEVHKSKHVSFNH